MRACIIAVQVLALALASSIAASTSAQEPTTQQRRSRGRPTTATLAADTRVYDVVSSVGAREIETYVRRRVGDEWIVELSAPGSTTELRFDTLFNVRAYRHAAPGLAEVAVRLDDGRLRGTAPDAKGRTRAVDHPAPGIAGPRLLWLALVESMAELPGREITLPEMDLAGDGTPRMLPLRMQGTEPVTVPAGTFTAIRIATDDGAVYWVREQAPHVLLKLELPPPARLGGGIGVAGGARRTYALRSLAAPVPASTAEPAAGAPLLARDTPGFEVHAPDSASLAVATAGAARAASHFARLFKQPPARFATVLFDTEAQRLAHHDARYRERGLHVQRWRARSIDPRKPVAAVPLEALGLVARVEAGGALRTIGVAAGGPAAAAGLRVGDVLAAWNGEALTGATGAARARALVQALRPGDTTALAVTRAGARSTATLRAVEPTAALRADLQRLVLAAWETGPVSEAFVAHETVHQLVGHHLGLLPAWFNEGVAALVETPAEFAVQHAALRRHRDDLIPLAELFASAHPAAGGDVVTPGASSGDGGMLVTQTAADPAAARRVVLFYPQSRALLEFLLEREGDDVVRRVADGLRAGRPMTALLADMRHVPRTLPAFEQAWTAWLRARLA